MTPRNVSLGSGSSASSPAVSTSPAADGVSAAACHAVLRSAEHSVVVLSLLLVCFEPGMAGQRSSQWPGQGESVLAAIAHVDGQHC